MPTNQKLFVLSNGSALRYRLLKDSGNQHAWWRTNDGNLFRRFLEKPKKEHRPLLGLWNSKTDLYVVAADFDQLPEGYSDFPSLIADLEHQLGERAIVAPSASGKAKAFFVVESSPGTPMKPAIALSTLQAYLSGNLFAALDRSSTSLQQTFVTPTMASVLSARLPLCVPLRAVTPVQDLSDERTLVRGGREWCNDCSEPIVQSSFGYFRGSLKKVLPLQRFADGSEKKDLFLRTLIFISELIDNGYDLPVRRFAEMLDASPQSISDYIRELVELKMLDPIDSFRWKNAPKGKTYRAKGALARAIAKHSKGRTRTSLPLPTAIEAGKWSKTLYWVKLQHFRNDPEGYMRWFYSLPGWNEEDRRRNALNNVEQAHNGHVRALMERVRPACGDIV